MSISIRLAKKLAERAIDEKHNDRVFVPVSILVTLLEELTRQRAVIGKLKKAMAAQ